MFPFLCTFFWLIHSWQKHSYIYWSVYCTCVYNSKFLQHTRHWWNRSPKDLGHRRWLLQSFNEQFRRGRKPKWNGWNNHANNWKVYIQWNLEFNCIEMYFKVFFYLHLIIFMLLHFYSMQDYGDSGPSNFRDGANSRENTPPDECTQFLRVRRCVRGKYLHEYYILLQKNTEIQQIF